ncbi:MAG: thioredoxin family protein [Thiobacillus sp.]|nr:thioredoxin family protein [Thiobacillus sp.]
MLKPNAPCLHLTVVGMGEPLLKLQKRLSCAAVELGMTLQLRIEKNPEPLGLRYDQTPAVLAQGRVVLTGLPRTEEIVAILRECIPDLSQQSGVRS